MNKQEFLLRLGEALSGRNAKDREERLNFYSEMIDDRMEDGLSETDAVSAVGSVEDIVTQVIADTPLAKIAKERMKPNRRLKTWEIVLLVLGSPIWLAPGIAAVAVVLSLYISLWAVIVSLWSVFASFVGCALGGIVGGIVFAVSGNALIGVAVIGAAIVLVGLSVFVFFGCKAATNGVLLLTKKMAVRMKNCFIKKEAAQ